MKVMYQKIHKLSIDRFSAFLYAGSKDFSKINSTSYKIFAALSLANELESIYAKSEFSTPKIAMSNNFCGILNCMSQFKKRM